MVAMIAEAGEVSATGGVAASVATTAVEEGDSAETTAAVAEAVVVADSGAMTEVTGTEAAGVAGGEDSRARGEAGAGARGRTPTHPVAPVAATSGACTVATPVAVATGKTLADKKVCGNPA